MRIMAAFGCLVASKSANMMTPLLYGAAVDLVNGSSGFAMSALGVLVAGMRWRGLASKCLPKRNNIYLLRWHNGQCAARQ